MSDTEINVKNALAEAIARLSESAKLRKDYEALAEVTRAYIELLRITNKTVEKPLEVVIELDTEQLRAVIDRSLSRAFGPTRDIREEVQE